MVKKKSIVISVLTLTLLIILSSCGGADLPAQDEIAIAQVALYTQPIQDWDPHTSVNTENQIYFNTYETLLRYDPNKDEFIPVLATDYTKTGDGLIWTFTLREGVKFHDGTDFNADAVKFSIDRIMRMAKGASYIWAPVKEVRVVDEYTVEIELSENAPLDIICSSSQAAFIASPTSIGDDDQAGTTWLAQGNICGTGPYMLQSQTPGSEVILTQFPDYWAGWDGNHFDKVVFSLVGENSSRRQLIESGEIDVVTNLMPDDLIALEGNPNVEVVISDSYKSLTAFLNTKKAPLDDKIVRQALAFSYPYQSYVDHIKLGKFGSIAVDTLLPKGFWGALDKNPYVFDLEKAKSLLEEAGYPGGGIELTVTSVSGMDDRKKILEIWKSELDKIGVTLDIVLMQADGMLSLANSADRTLAQDIFVIGNWPDLISPNSYYSSQVKSSGSWNFSYQDDKALDKAIDDAYIMSGIDREKSEKMFKDIGAKIAEECLTINLGDDKGAMVINKSFKGFVPNMAYEMVVFMYDCYRD